MLRLLIVLTLQAQAQTLHQVALSRPVPEGKVIAIGFLGAWERWDDENRNVRKLALRLRQNGIEAETFGNHNLRTAKKAVTAALDRDGNGRIDPEEAAAARLILFGQSLGGGATVALARFLHSKNVPVLLTVQVDSVGFRDGVIPPNVKVAANFYQHHWFTIRGENRIRAKDPARTRVLGNYEFEYPLWKVHTWPESWPRRVLGGAHARMEADPLLWRRIENLVLEASLGKESTQ